MAETFISAAVIKEEMLNPLILLLWYYEQEWVLNAEDSSSSRKMAARRDDSIATPWSSNVSLHSFHPSGFCELDSFKLVLLNSGFESLGKFVFLHPTLNKFII